jgi:hypothetical protein
MLYVVSDVTFFRIKFFTYIVKIAQFYKDYCDSRLGYPSDDIDEKIITNSTLIDFAKIDPIFNSDGTKNLNSPFLYYTVRNCYSEKAFREQFLDIILRVVNENKMARERSGFRELV